MPSREYAAPRAHADRLGDGARAGQRGRGHGSPTKADPDLRSAAAWSPAMRPVLRAGLWTPAQSVTDPRPPANADAAITV